MLMGQVDMRVTPLPEGPGRVWGGCGPAQCQGLWEMSLPLSLTCFRMSQRLLSLLPPLLCSTEVIELLISAAVM